MTRPSEYVNLLQIGAFKEAASSKDSIEQFMRNAQELLAASKTGLGASPRFLLALRPTLG